MSLELRYYWSVFVRRLPIFLLVAVSFGTAGAAVATLLPTTYTARALMLVESQQIPTDMVESTVRIDPRQALEVMQQRLMTRSNAIDIAREFNVYADVATMNPDQIVSAVRSDTRLRSMVRNRAILMEVEFSARTGGIAAQVANEYVTRILSDNARQRMRVAEETLSFFEQEVERLEKELEQASARILNFQSRNASALPATLEARMRRRDTLEERIATTEAQLAEIADQRARLVAIFERTGEVRSARAEPQSPEERQLATLRRDLSSALAVYSEQSPQVRILRARLEQLETRIATIRGTDEGGVPGEPGTPLSEQEVLDLQLAEIDKELDRLRAVQAAAVSEVAELEETIERTPANSIALEGLEREYRNLQSRYDAAVRRLATAQTGERIEVMAKGERITVLEQAVPPSEPDSPDRVTIAAGGVAAGIAAGLGLITLLEVLDRSIRRPVDLVRGLGIAPLVTIPYIRTRGERIRRRLLALALALFVLVGIPAVLYFVHYEIMPLDLLIDRVAARIGL